MNKHLIMILIGCCSINILWSQHNFKSFFEPEIELGYQVGNQYFHSFNIENRNIIYESSQIQYMVKQIDLGHTSTYLINEQTALGIGIQYRFEDTFDDSEENELRLSQEVEWSSDHENFSLKNRLRNEFRLYDSTTKYRWRYEIGFKLPIINSQSSYLKLETESLLELATTQKPELEQRLTSLYGWSLSPSTGIEMGLQYRLANYTQDLGHEVFFVVGFDFFI